MLWSQLIAISVWIFTPPLCAEEGEGVIEREDWGRFYDDLDVTGTIVISDDREPEHPKFVYNAERAQLRFPPASTFKIPHTLFALDAEIIRDEFEIIAWDGKKRFHPPWNRDQNLHSSVRHSVVWVYEQFAEKLGQENERKYLAAINYGNQDPSGKKPFWIHGKLRISAYEQMVFLRKLYKNNLPFKKEHQRLVKDTMIVEAQLDRVLRAKTGWDGKVAWWIGWVETPEGAVFFAHNMDTPNGAQDLPEREAIPRSILRSLGVFPLKHQAP
ncbi:MAG: class D beta-lactamase [Akkermansiaceae bacterium]